MSARILKIFFLKLLVITSIAAAQGSVFYVSPLGDDASNGTITSPWRTIGKAANTLVAGDTVYIRAGTYNEMVRPKNSGTDADHRILYAAYPGEKVTIDGHGIVVPEFTGLFHIEGKKYITVSGLRIIDSSYYGLNADTSSYIQFQGNVIFGTVSSGMSAWTCFSVIMDGNDISKACIGGQQEAISVAQTRRFEVRNNHVHHTPDKEGICIKDGSSFGKVYGNQVDHTSDTGIYLDAWKHRTHHIAVYNNTVHHVREHDASGIGVASEMGGLLESIRIFNNIVHHNPYVGIEVSDYGATGVRPMRNIWIINNTLWRNGHPWGGGITCQNPDIKGGVVIRNNISSENTAFQIAVAPALYNKAVKVDHNLIYPFQGEESEVTGSEPVLANPLLVNPFKSDFHLKKASPAIDAGSPLLAPGFDFDQQSRPQDGNGDGIIAVDLGACESPGNAGSNH